MRWWRGEIRSLTDKQIIVFGSNPQGRHGKGAAKFAMKFGATYGQGRGLSGHTYALVTKNLKPGFVELLSSGRKVYHLAGPRSLSKTEIMENIQQLYDCCRDNPDKVFYILYRNDGIGLNGYSSAELWEMFNCFEVPENVSFHISFKVFRKKA